jgi:hypothetical protein
MSSTITRVCATTVDQMESQLEALSLSEKGVSTEVQKTTEAMVLFQEKMLSQVSFVEGVNLQLCAQLISLEGRQNETVSTCKAEVTAAQKRAEAAEEEALALRREMEVLLRRTDEHVAAETTAKVQAVQAATLAGEERIRIVEQREREALQRMERMRAEFEGELAAVRAEKALGIQAANQEGAAQVALARQEVEAMRQEVARAMEKTAEGEVYHKDTETIMLLILKMMNLYDGIIRGSYGPGMRRKWMDPLQNILIERINKPRDSRNGVDIQKILPTASSIPMEWITRCARWQPQLPGEAKDVQAKLLAFIAEVKLRI